MELFIYVLVAFLIYLILLIPLAGGIFAIILLMKLIDVGGISIWDIIKSMAFLLIVGLFLSFIFFYFAVNPFHQFVNNYSNPYVNIFVLLVFLGVILFFIGIHFKLFSLYIDKFYLTTLRKDIFLYIVHLTILILLVYFYLKTGESFSYLMHYAKK